MNENKMESNIENTNHSFSIKTISKLPLPLYLIAAKETQITWVSAKTVDISGFSADKLTQVNFWFSRIHPDDHAAYMKSIEQAKKNISTSVEYRWKMANNTYKWFRDKLVADNTENTDNLQIIDAWEDITEIKSVAQKLVKSREEYRIFFEQDLTGDFVSTPKGKLLDCNAAFLAILGFTSKEQAINYNVKQLYTSPAERQKIIDLLNANKSIINHEYQMIRLDGKIISLIANIFGVFDSNGKLQKIKGYIFDTTKSKLALSEIKKLSRAVEQSPALVVITDTSGNIEYVNAKFTEVTGYSKEEVIGENPRILKSGNLSNEVYKNLWETILSGKEWKGEFQNRKKDGTYYWEAATITQIKNNQGEITHFIAIKEDITEQKKIEQRFQVIFNISNAANTSETLEKLLKTVSNELGKIMNVTNFFVALYNKQNNQITLPYYSDEKFKIETFPKNKTLTHYVIQSKKPFWANRKELDKLAQNGIVKFVGEKAKTWMGVPLMVKGEATGAFVVQNYDNENAFIKEDLELLEYVSNKISQVIERKKNEQLLREALNRAQESDRLKSAFLATMSHELRTPLNAVIGFSELITGDTSPEDTQQFAQIIHNSGKHLLEIVESIFDITLIESGDVKISKSEFDINETIEKLLENAVKWQQNFQKTHIDIIFKPSPELTNVQIFSDQKKLNQILTQLLKNALKFTEKGHIEIGYHLKTELKKTCVEFYVKDSGIGIPPEAQKVIFDMFRQADDTHTRKYEGVGIGLTIAQKNVQLLGGEIRVESTAGEGSTFSFTIPYENDISTGNHLSKLPDDIHFSGKTILIAEDEQSNYQILKAYLDNTGANILWAKNGKEAIDYCSQTGIHLILMDIKMPILDGLEATRIIRKKYPNLPIIAQTAFAFNGDYKKAMEAGCDNYIVKPLYKKKLFQLIKQHIN